MSDPDFHELFDQAAEAFAPEPDLDRLETALRAGRRTRPVVYTLGAVAAAAALAVGGAAAMSGDTTAERIVPADAPVTVPDDSNDRTSTTIEPSLRELDPERLFAPPASTAPPATTIETTHATTTIVPSTTMDLRQEPDGGPLPPTTLHTPPTTHAPAPPPPPATHAPATTHPPVTTAAPSPPPAPTAPPTTTPPTTAPPTHPPTTTSAPTTTHPPATTQPPTGFTANQTWGSCGDDPPYEELFGTAAAGSTISVSSPYGSGSTTAKADGTWYVQVFFPSAPPYQSFTIGVSSAQGSASFPFVHNP